MRSKYRATKLVITALGALASVIALDACVGKIDGGVGTAESNTGTGNGIGTGTGTGTGTGSSSMGTGVGSTASGNNAAGSASGSMTGSASTTPTLAVGAAYTRLTIPEYVATIKAAFGVVATVSGIPADSRVGPFTSNAAVSPDPAAPFMLAGEDLAALIVPAKIPACPAASASTCFPATLQGPIEKLYRRSLSAAEITVFTSLLSTLEKAGVASQDATRQLVSTVLMSPDFLFRANPAAGDAARAQQLSEQLSFALWDAPPDAALATAAQGSAADLGSRLKTQAMRLAKDPQAVTPLARFMAQWLGVDVDNNLSDPTYATNPLYVELLAFVQDALANNVPVTSFVNGTRGFVQKGNFAAYAMTAVSTTGNVAQVTWPATSARRGMIGEELLMDATRDPNATLRPIFRGKLVQESLLCTQIPPPPPALQALAGDVPDRTTDTRCKGCHLLMEPVGAAFASVDLDHTGTTPAAVLTGNADVAGTYADLPSLLDKIAKSKTFADCFSSNLLGFFLEQDPIQVDPGAVADVSALVKSGAGFADVVAQTVVTLEARSKSAIPWCAAP